VHAFPKADVPVVQLAIDARKDFDFHFELDVQLAPLRDRGVLVLGSGNAVSNQGAQVLVDGFAFGSLSMTSFTLDAERPPDSGDRRPGAGLPDPRDTPTEDTNA
jgi:aromatic ring-opening dioxygenase catalytic subunit (LigB family)